MKDVPRQLQFTVVDAFALVPAVPVPAPVRHVLVPVRLVEQDNRGQRNDETISKAHKTWFSLL